MRILLLYGYPLEMGGESLQGHYLAKGLKENGHEVLSCDLVDEFQKEFAYKIFKPDYVIGVGFWGDTKELIEHPLDNGFKPIPWLNADGWVANYHDIIENLPLVFVTSNWVKNTYIRDGLTGNNIHVAHIGFDSDIFNKQEDREGAKIIREALGIKDDEMMIFTAGGDVTSKGAQEMLRALAKINSKFPKWKYVCKTYSSYPAKLHGKEENRLIEELGIDKNKIIRLEGKYSQEFMAALLNACDIYAAPSRIEGFGMIQVEAQACGKPVISINVGGPKDTIIHGKTGFLVEVGEEVKLDREWVYKSMGFKKKHQIQFVEPKTFAYKADVNILAECLLKLLTDDELRNEMGEAARIHAYENFNYNITAKKIADIIEKLN